MNEIKDIILSLENILTARMRRKIHYRSMRNFVMHFGEIKGEGARERICGLLSDYIEEVKGKNYDFSGKGESGQLARKYLWVISDYYKEDAGFIVVYSLRFVILAGILGDSLLYFTGLSAAIFHLPVVFIVLLLYYIFIGILKVPQGWVYGIFY